MSFLPDFHGLSWTPTLFSLDPTWTLTPSPSAIAELIKSLGVRDATITFLAQGAFNKVYTITSPSLSSPQDLILRLALPVDPRFKTLSEVVTMEWMSQNTSAPVPRVVRYGESKVNIVGLEWILMTRLPGRHLGDVWRTISYAAKVALVKRIAGLWGELFRRRMRGNVPRGPFRSSREWMLARLALHENESRASLEKLKDVEKEGMDSDTEDELESAERTLDIVMGLKKVVDLVFPAGKTGEEETVFFHHDLSNHNVLVDDEGALTGLLDWECVSAVPLWKACDFPEFLVEKPREVKPEQSNYEAIDGEACDLYWEHVLEYELTNLRQVFLAEMERVEPRWVGVFKKSQMERDLDYAVLYCDDELSARDIRYWSDDVVSRKEDILSLEERRHGFFKAEDNKDTVVLY